MAKTMNRWGSGPIFSLVSGLCFAAAVALRLFLPSTFDMGPIPYKLLLAVGAALIGLGASLWIWSVISVMRAYNAKALCTTGPFAMCRHPVYASWVVFIVPGVALVMNSWIALVVPAIMCVLLHLVVRQEEAYLIETFGESYVEYRRRTPAVLPIGWLSAT
ncbi:MAG: isoprenylcysteine carboxylmethyltransferase family protein [Phycisphaerae bacterium]|nr:isoprenylcysteine carboxylmethyltransferase family protein [Phycisphaerae bacterium]